MSSTAPIYIGDKPGQTKVSVFDGNNVYSKVAIFPRLGFNPEHPHWKVVGDNAEYGVVHWNTGLQRYVFHAFEGSSAGVVELREITSFIEDRNKERNVKAA